MNATQGGKRRTEDELRQHAEARLRGDARPRDPAVEGTMQLVHELEVYQVELELQNEELRDTRDRLEQASRHYTELFDFAPIGYLMLDRNGVVTKANLAGAKLLATDRGTLTGARFGFFVSPTDRSRLDEYLQEVFGSDGRHTCELALEGDSQVTRIVRVEAVRVREQQTCRIVMLDIHLLVLLSSCFPVLKVYGRKRLRRTLFLKIILLE